MKTGFYWIITGDRDSDGNYIHVPALEEGSFHCYGALMVNRKAEYRHNPEKDQKHDFRALIYKLGPDCTCLASFWIVLRCYDARTRVLNV